MNDLSYELEILRSLISFNTDANTKKEYKQCADFIENECRALGLKTEIFDAKEEAKDGIPRPSVVARLEKGSNKTIALAMHYDVVPPGSGWKKDPFRLTIEDNFAYGRGVVDDKGCIATTLGVIREARDKIKYNLAIFIVPEEEVGGKYGMGFAVKNFRGNIDEVLVLDASNEYISIGASGVVFGEIRVYGTQGHAGYPFRYRNAAQDLIRLAYHLSDFSKLRSMKISRFKAPPGSPIDRNFGRFSITIIRAGEKENVIPGEAYLRFDMRLIPEEDSELAIEELKSYLSSLSNQLGIKAELSWIEGKGSNYFSDPESESVKKFKEIVEDVYKKKMEIVTELGGNDGRYFSHYSVPIISFGLAREGTRYHGPDEFLDLNDMRNLKEILFRYLTS